MKNLKLSSNPLKKSAKKSPPKNDWQTTFAQHNINK